MLLSKILRFKLHKKTISTHRCYSNNQDPLKKTWKVLSNDMKLGEGDATFYPEHADIVIIGGGFIGSSVAYWLKTRAAAGLSIVVIEKDFSYKGAQNNVSLGTLCQHFSLPENIELSKFSAEFLRNIKEHLDVNVDIQYRPTGSLVLASERYASKFEDNIKFQNEFGIRNVIFTPKELKAKYPWLNIDDVKFGSTALEGEGTFNSWALLKGLVQKSKELGTTYVDAEVVDFQLQHQRDVLMEGVTPGSYHRLNRVIYRDKNNEEHAIKFAVCVLAAGDNSGNLAALANIGTGDGLLQVPLPIERRDCPVYSIEQKTPELGLTTPLVMDTTGLWLMRNGLESNLFCGSTPLIKDEYKNMAENEYYKDIVEASLYNRIPSCKGAQISKISTEMHDCNTFDNTGILGPHPYHNNLYIAAGFGKLGCVHAPGLGKAVSELIIDSQFTSVDLTRFGFDRLLTKDPLVEFNVY